MKFDKQSLIVGLVIGVIMGSITGGLVLSRHYGVGPLADLRATPSSADGPCGADDWLGTIYGPAGSSTMSNVCVTVSGVQYTVDYLIRGMVNRSNAGRWYFIAGPDGGHTTYLY